MTEHIAHSVGAGLKTGGYRRWTSRASRRACAVLCAAVLVAVLQHSSRAQGFGFGFGGGADIEVVKQFDKDGNGRLDAAERQPARQWLSSNNNRGFGRRRFGGRQGASQMGRPLSPADVKSAGQAALYDPAAYRTLFLQFENSTDWEDELAAFYGTDVDVPATVIVDGATYKDVGVHFRGMSSFRMVPDGAKRSLNLTFDFANPQQRLRGYKTLNLLNANGDPTMMRAVLYSEIARHYTPTPKSNFVRVVINGEDWGTYVNAQQFNTDFTREWFSSTGGARWKVPGSPRGQAGMEYLGEAVSTYKRLYEIKSKDTPKSWADLINMFKVLNQTPLDKLEAALSPLLDIDGTLKFLALEVALVNSDGYWARASDYSIYQDPSGKFHVIPHDINEAMDEGRFGFGGGGGVSLEPLVGLNDASKPLRSRLLAVPALRARYLGYVKDIAQKWMDWRALEPLVEQYRALLTEEMKVDARKLYSFEAFQSGLSGGPDSLRGFMDRRRAFLLQPSPAASVR
jgi:hypothetical protein